jgi:hypothetical protein
VKVFLLIVTVSAGAVQTVQSVGMTTLEQCAEVREALYRPRSMLMCVESAVPLPKKRAGVK